MRWGLDGFRGLGRVDLSLIILSTNANFAIHKGNLLTQRVKPCPDLILKPLKLLTQHGQGTHNLNKRRSTQILNLWSMNGSILCCSSLIFIIINITNTSNFDKITIIVSILVPHLDNRSHVERNGKWKPLISYIDSSQRLHILSDKGDVWHSHATLVSFSLFFNTLIILLIKKRPRLIFSTFRCTLK